MTLSELDRSFPRSSSDNWGLFFLTLVNSELFVWLEEEVRGEVIDLKDFPTDAGPIALAFDREERLSAFVGTPQPYAALPGRVLLKMLKSTGIGLGVNLDVAPSSTILTPEMLEWCLEKLQVQVSSIEPTELMSVRAPASVPPSVSAVLQSLMRQLRGSALECAVADAIDQSDQRMSILIIRGAGELDRTALTGAFSEALAFAGVDDEWRLCVDRKLGKDLSLPTFAAPSADPIAQPRAMRAPRSDPDKPPILR